MKPYICIENKFRKICNDVNIVESLESSYIAGNRLTIKLLCIFDVKELIEKSYEKFEYVGETIEAIALELISKYNYDIVKRNFYSYIMREMMRNVVEHSKAEKFCLALYIGDEDEIAFKVIDTGIGIKKSLNSHPNYNVNDSVTALAFSIRPGITKTHKRDPSIDDMWQNSGFGLYMVSSIGNKLGYFSIISGESELFIKNSIKSYNKRKFKGTEVTVAIKNNIKLNTSILLKEISQQGNELAKNSLMFSRYAEIKTASKASTLLNEYN
ncbi:ATP-binding protein [Clostridium gasigenes]|uniref:Sensor histidine kinase n=1 Tax=Clostridium gasigenes TaxID=94869 RepID=A0A7X0SEE0_9CLOT|nr:ATP-binding protein [Clostridium gasigenes]MBB6715960.1 sensor histidine kinase [Clostridium gasigenes]